MNRVFAVFTAHWPRKFWSIWKTADAVTESKRSWFLAFQDCPHLTVATMDCGLRRVREQSWPPDNAGEFLKLCHRLPEDVGAPTFDSAFREAAMMSHPGCDWRRWSHKCVYWGATWTGLSDINDLGYRKRDSFDREYQKALDCAEELAEPPKGALPERTSAQRTADQEAAAAEWLPKIRKLAAGEKS